MYYLYELVVYLMRKFTIAKHNSINSIITPGYKTCGKKCFQKNLMTPLYHFICLSDMRMQKCACYKCYSVSIALSKKSILVCTLTLLSVLSYVAIVTDS